jgi:cytochrome c oxidase subunit 2
MQTVVVVHSSQDELDAWIKQNSGRRGETPEEYGALLYSRRGCASCHSVNGTKLVGPSFQGSYGTEHAMVSGEMVKVDENYVRESILEPKAKVVAGYAPVMPSFKGQLSDDDIDSLIAYIKSLNPSAGDAATKFDSPSTN